MDRDEGAFSRRAVLATSLGVAALPASMAARGKQRKRRKRRKHLGTLTRTSTASQPDVLVFLTDDMRTDDWPILAQAQARIGGAWFPNFCFNVAVCGASRATLLTGQHARTHGVLSNWRTDQLFQPHEADSLAPAVQGAGYYTSYVGKYMNEYNGNRVPPGWSDWRAMTMDGDTYKIGGKYATSVVTSSVRQAILAAPSDKPLFMIISHHAPHEPHTPAKRYAKKSAESEGGRSRTLVRLQQKRHDGRSTFDTAGTASRCLIPQMQSMRTPRHSRAGAFSCSVVSEGVTASPIPGWWRLSTLRGIWRPDRRCESSVSRLLRS